MKGYEYLKTEHLTARQSGNALKAGLLSTLIGEVELEAKRGDITVAYDTVLEKVAIRFKKNMEDTVILRTVDASKKAQAELDIIREYCPTELSEDDIRTLVTVAVNQHGKDMKTIMPILKAQEGMNMKVAAQIIKSL